MKFSLLCEQQNSQAGKLFPAAGQVKYRIGHNRNAPANVCQSIPDSMHDDPRFEDRDRESRIIRSDSAGGIIVNMRRAPFFGTDCRGAHPSRLGRKPAPWRDSRGIYAWPASLESMPA